MCKGVRVLVGAAVIMGAGAMDASGQTAGWEAPSYADTVAFVERTVTVGAAPFELPATLTLPVAAREAAGVPVVVLVHGSGPHDRDSTLGVKKPLKDIAWGLAARGVAVLRYEKRTRVYGAQMDPTAVTIEEETIADALAAFDVARAQPETDDAGVFLLGHSLGGMIAPEAAVRDGRLAGVIMLAAGARPFAETVLAQLDYLSQTPENQIPQAVAQLAQMRSLAERIGSREAAPADMGLGAPASYFYDLDERAAPSHALAVRVPMLVLQGERDYQVTMEDFEIWQAALADRDDVEFRSYPGLDHLFVYGAAASTPREMMLVPGNVAEPVIADIARFVMATVR